MAEEKQVNEQEPTTATEVAEQPKKDKVVVKPGMTVKVHEKIKEKNAKGEEKQRIQIFQGMVLATHKINTPEGTFTVRKIGENNIGVEKIYPINSPLIDKIEPVKQARVRRAKLFFLRNYKKKLKEEKIS